ncbi:tRNA methyltransferase ppm2 [Lithohypha guttulata]|uniref:tRNA methyltransferase ppm2 n=1 Tax=Lithohypha guttulata TaxID=1690604 RepID=A0ABR0KPM8_9EURO|nr:tRNA methyltransferase ppm2 [Lithohypha guttulata]
MASPVNDAPMGAIIDDEIQIEKNAGLVMATNNSSIVSKRSVEKLYLPEPHFFRYFVKKPVRRAPTINRGYWLRMRAVDDPVPFQWLARDPSMCANTKFVDVDYELLMETKRKIIRDTPKMFNLLHPYNADATGIDKSVLIDSEEYAAIGCDLRNIPRLERLLREVVDVENCLILCVAEVSITYMQTEAADNLIGWSSTLSPDVTFCLLEQCSPDQMDNPFTMTMMKHFAKLGTPLRSVMEYPGQHAQNQRFRAAGFTNIDYQNLWELWADARFLSPSQRVALDHVEPFDEWEEFALFASHYCLVVAHNRDAPILTERPRSRRDSTASVSSDISARTSSPHKPGNEWFGFRYSKEPGDLCQRHHGSAYTIPDQEAVGVHGGVGTRSRLSTTAVTRPRNLTDAPPVVPPPEIGARCCHTITPLDSGQNLLVGGRASPTQVFKDCWLQTGHSWRRVHDLPQPRYRHRMSGVVLPDGTSGAICFGGKTDHCTVATEILLWEPNSGWRVLRTSGPDPVPRFAPIFMKLGFNHGLLFGGMRQDGIVCQGLWRWRLHVRNGVIVNLTFRPTSAVDASTGTWPWFARFGASYSMQRDEVLVIGGVAKAGCIPKPYEILSLVGCFSNYKDHERELPLRVASVTPARSPDCPRPLLVGHSTHRTKSGLSITLGGGCTCFSFGNYFNTGIWILYDREAGLTNDWIIVPTVPALVLPEKDSKPAELTNGHCRSRLVERANIESAEDFDSKVVRWMEPRLLDGLDFGSCISRWSLPYLKDKISAVRNVVVHDSPARTMNFQRKDFTYRNLPFHHFLNKLNDKSSHLYLRSLAAESPSSYPADLSKDWPEIASDFHIPPQLRDIAANMHSSPLRISNDISMWLHYDVMANVLFQVAGVKRLVLFPATDLPKLGFPPGSTTSELDLFSQGATPGGQSRLEAPLGTAPIVAILRPGDALYIPPLWAHTGVSLPNEEGSKHEHSDSHSVWAQPGASLPLNNGDDHQHSKTRSASHSDSSHKGAVSSDSHGSTNTSYAQATQIQGAGEVENPYLNIAVNVFFRNLPESSYAAGRDVYGNRDLACYEDGRKMVERLVSKFKDSKQQAEVSKGSSVLLDWIPKDVRKAYLLRLARELEQEAEKL